jgi:surfactin synthase thioesterase subunit
LFCFPFAGAGPSFYHSWSRLGVEGLEVRPVQLAGRERLVDEPAFTDLHAAADALAAQVLSASGGEPTALFGHCFMGCVLAFEVALRLTERDDRAVRHLFVSASRPPAEQRRIGAASMSDDDFVAMVKSSTGYEHPALDIPEMREMLLPTLRADFAMDESYAPRGNRPISAPITAIVAADDPLATREQVSRWAAYTSGAFDLAQVAGAHMYLASDPIPLLEMIVKTLSAPAGSAHEATR